MVARAKGGCCLGRSWAATTRQVDCGFLAGCCRAATNWRLLDVLVGL